MNELKCRGYFMNNVYQVNKKHRTYSFYKVYKLGNPSHYSLAAISLILIDTFEYPNHIHPLKTTVHPNSYCIALGTQIGQWKA